MRMYSKCHLCGRQYHIAGPCDCQMEDYWRRQARSLREAAKQADENAEHYKNSVAADDAAKRVKVSVV